MNILEYLKIFFSIKNYSSKYFWLVVGKLRWSTICRFCCLILIIVISSCSYSLSTTIFPFSLVIQSSFHHQLLNLFGGEQDRNSFAAISLQLHKV